MVSTSVSLQRWTPRRAPGLPPGQHVLAVMPRFANRPRRPPPVVLDHTLKICIDNQVSTIHTATELAENRVARVADFHCVTGWSVRSLRWAGVQLVDIVDGETAIPRFARVVAHDGVAAVYLTEDLLDERTLLATHLDGCPLDPCHGAPIRLVTPHLYGYKNIKHVARIEFLADEPASVLGVKEHLRARVDREERHALLPNWVIRWPYRLLIPVIATLAERSRDPESASRRGRPLGL